MDQLNVRNVDEQLWQRVREEATRRRASNGAMLNRILKEWFEWWDERGERARRANGIFAHIAPGRSLVDELIAERHEEFLREEEKDEELRREAERTR
jgi:hypothetical protein